MRTLNVRLVVILLGCTAVFVPAVLAINYFQVRRSASFVKELAEEAKERAEEAKEAGKFEKALEEYDEAVRKLLLYLNLAPDDIEAAEEYAYMLADIVRYKGKITHKWDRRIGGAAFGAFEDVLRKDSTRSEARRRLVDFAIEFGMFAVAKEHLEDYLLKESPNDGQLLAYLARCQLQDLKRLAAADSYRQALRNAPELVAEYYKLATLLRQIGKGKGKGNDAWKEADFWMGVKTPEEGDKWDGQSLTDANPESAQAHYLAARWLTGFNEYDRALEALSRSLELEPGDRGALELAARCCAGKQDFDQARDYANEGIKRHPKSVSLYLVLADVEWGVMRRQQQAAMEEQADGESEKAKECFALAEVHRKLSVDVLRRGVAATEEHPHMVWNLANRLLSNGEIEEAQQVTEGLRLQIASLRSKTTTNARELSALAGYLQARIEFVHDRWRTAIQGRKARGDRPAIQGFEQVRPKLADLKNPILREALKKQTDFYLAHCHGQLGQRELQVACLERILRMDPKSAPALVSLAEVMSSLGKLDKALEYYGRLHGKGKFPPGARIQEAQILFVKTMQMKPEKRSWTKVEDALEKARKATPRSSLIPLLAAEILVAQGRADDAAAVLDEAGAESSDPVAIVIAHASLAMRNEEWEQADAILTDAVQKLGDDVRLRLFRAKILVARDAENLLESLQALAQNTEGLKGPEMRLFLGLTEIAMRLGHKEFSRELCRKVAAMRPEDIRILFFLFEQAVRIGNEADMKEMLQEIEKLEGQAAHWHFGRARLLNWQAKDGGDPKLTRALQHLNEASKLRKNWPGPLRLRGNIYERQGNPKQALVDYDRAIELGERNPEVLFRTMSLWNRQGHPDKAKAVLQLLSQRQTSSNPLEGFKIDWLMGERDEAIEKLRNLTRDSENYQDFILLGQMLAQVGREAEVEKRTAVAEKKFQEAEQALRRAVELSDETPETWLALIQFFASTGRQQDGLAAIKQLQDKLPPDRADLILAGCYRMLGLLDRAEIKYLAALKAAPDDPATLQSAILFFLQSNKLSQAEELLTQIVDGKVQAEEPLLVWARRSLGVLLASLGGHENLEKGIALIRKNLSVDDSSLDDIRMMARMLMRHQNRSRRQEAIQMFTRLTAADSQAVVPRDRYDLVRLYLWENNWNAANEQFLHLLGMPGGNRPEYLAAFVSALIQHDEYNDAGIWLARLERLAPHQLKTAGVKAKLAFSQKRYKEAINVIANYVADPASEPSDPATRLSEGAAYLELFASLLKSKGPADDEAWANKFVVETEIMLRQYIRKRPEDALQLGRFFGRQGQIEDALKLVKSTWKESDAVTVAQTLKAILCNAATTEAQAKQGEAILRAAMEKFNEPVGFLVVIAEAQTYQGNYGEAEGYYRQILKENPKQPLALNNLAVLLAIQKKSLHEALRLIDRAIGVSGPEPAMLDSKACVLMASGKPEAALQILDRAIKDRPTAIRCFHQAQAYDQAGQTSNAAAALKRADELDLTPKRLLPTEREALVRLRKKLL